MSARNNPAGMRGIQFVEFAGNDPAALDRIFKSFGFSKIMRHRSQNVEYYRQNHIDMLLNNEPASFALDFAGKHGQSICSMGWKVTNAEKALEWAVSQGARAYQGEKGSKTFDVPAIYGIGDSLIYFVETFGKKGSIFDGVFEEHPKPEIVEEKGFLAIDHLTNNVHKGTMHEWADFYKNIFGFTEVRYFDIKGKETGLTSYALKSGCGTFCIPINEGTEEKSQIEEYLREYDGPGIQHLAFLTKDLLDSLDRLEGNGIETLDIIPSYYDEVFDRVPNVTEDRGRIRRHDVLVDGDDDGYLLQIFTRNLFGPIFIEMIQRKNHRGFGEGNFQALFDSIERDQRRRGVL